MRISIVVVLAVCLAGLAPSSSIAEHYNPLAPLRQQQVEPVDLIITDSDRDREIPIRVYLSPGDGPVPVVLFSHGLGGSRRAGGYLGQHWSARGYAVVCLQHAGSDESVWRGLPARQRLQALKDAPSGQNTIARFEDVKAALDQLGRWNDQSDHRFGGRFDLEKVGMSGHSYGASTTQGVSGQAARLVGQRYTDRRIDAAIMFSPNIPRRGTPQIAFGKVSIPWLLMTGTKDTSPINDTTVDDRRQVYPALPETIDRYELVLFDAEHSAFGDSRQRQRSRNPNHHPVIKALSTAFWDTYLRDDSAAAAWLRSDAARGIMEEKDLWQFGLAEKSAD